MSKKLKINIAGAHCIPATCCCDDASRGGSTARDGEWQVSELQHACSHLTCFTISLHAWQWAHTSGQTPDLEDTVPALGTRTAHAFAHARLAGVSRNQFRSASSGVHTTLLRAELPGSWHRHRRQCHLGCIKEQESPCSSQSVGCNDKLWYQVEHGLPVWAMLKVSD